MAEVKASKCHVIFLVELPRPLYQLGLFNWGYCSFFCSDLAIRTGIEIDYEKHYLVSFTYNFVNYSSRGLDSRETKTFGQIVEDVDAVVDTSKKFLARTLREDRYVG